MNARVTSPALGIGYSLWLRGRASLGAAFALVVALAVFARLVPALQLPVAFGAGIHVELPSVVFLAPVVLLPVLALLDVFTFGPVDLGATGSPLPLHVRLLPLSTRALVGWPMLFAVVTLATLWLALLTLVLHPTGAMTATLWPTAILVACTLWTQAIAWIPCPARFLRLPLLFVFVGVPIGLASVDPRRGDHYWAFLAAMVMYAAAAWATAIVGLSRARAGTSWPELRWPAWAKGRAPSSARMVTPFFSSPAAARRWYETRRNTSFLTRAFGVASLPLIAYSALGIACPGSYWIPAVVHGRMPLPTVLSAVFLAVGPPLFSASMGGRLGRFDFWTRPGMSPFFALRPVSTARLVGDKLLSAGIVVAPMCAVCLLVAAAGYGAWRASSEPPRLPAVDLLLVTLAYAFVLWRNLVVDVWTAMLGRAWPRRCSAALTAVAFAAFPLVVTRIVYEPALQHRLVGLAPWLAAALVVAKIVAAALVARALLRRRLVSAPHLAAGVAAWCLLGAAALLLASRYFALSWVAAIVVLAFVPLARIGLAAVALDAHRHR